MHEAYSVKEGIVRVYNVSLDGEEKPISFKLRDDIFSLGWLFNRYNRSLYFYEAHTDCALYVLDREKFHHELTTNVDSANELISWLVSEQISDGMRFNALEQSISRQKIAHMLQTFCLRYGRDVRTDVVHIDLPLRQRDIANFLGITRETAALELKKLKDQGVVSYRNRFYIVHTDKLNSLLDDEYNPGISL